jgi:hypothetical protein
MLRKISSAISGALGFNELPIALIAVMYVMTDGFTL